MLSIHPTTSLRLRRHGNVRLLRHGVGALPQGRDRLLLGVKVDAGPSVKGAGAAAGDALLVAGEGEHGQGHGDGDIDADLAGLNVAAERLGRGAGAREDGRAVAVFVLVDELNGVIESLDVEAHEDGAENLLGVALHLGRHVGDDGGGDPVAVGVLGRRVTTAVEEDGGALVLGALDERLDAGLAVRGDDGAKIGAVLEATVDLELLGHLGELGQPLLGLADHDEGADGGHDTEGLTVAPRLHVLGHLEHLALHELRRRTGGLGDLEATQDVALGIGKRLALLEGDAGGQAVPVLADQADEAEHDGLAVQHARRAPGDARLLGRVDGGLELGVGHLGHAGDEVVGGGVVEIDELVGLGLDKLIVDKVGRVFGLGNLVVSARERLGRRREGGAEVGGRGVYPPGSNGTGGRGIGGGHDGGGRGRAG
ncbi:hypothetical protein BN1723_015814 [Verticillium longisporum]|uniref:Uncharacterized protein n=1 Tax=Verticillium longisporum TaxID=100787 RepID=A0A0G4N399_VERLO|nr:hypothetical protein BN1723_015814 [Verticillium longisporum]